MATTPNIGLTLMLSNQNGAEVLFNEAAILLDIVRNAGLLTEATAPPGSPTNGTVRLVVGTATGTFTGKEKKLAVYWDGVWKFFPAASGDWPVGDHWSTTEFFTGIYRDGSPVYQKVVSFGAGPGAMGVANAAHGISGLLIAKPITIQCSAHLASPAIAIPGPVYYEPISGLAFGVGIDATNVVWAANFDMTAFTMKARLLYCK